jgi:hypothetical protein
LPARNWARVSLLGDAKSSLGDAKSSLGDAKSSLGDAKSSLGDATSSLGDAKSSLGVTLRARWVTLRARWVTLKARWVTLRARWVTLRARWVTLRARWVTLRARWVTLRARWVTSGGAGRKPGAGASAVATLVPCKLCGRTFIAARVAKHQQACALSTRSKRRVFNTAKQRLSGLDSVDRGLVRTAVKLLRIVTSYT